MATTKWATPGTASGNIASTVLDSLANATRSSQVTYDNSTNKNLYAAVRVVLGSIAATTTSTLLLHVQCTDGTGVPDNDGGDTYAVDVLTGTGAKSVVIPMIRLYPFSMRLSVTNNTSVALASSGNELHVVPYNEEVT